MVLSGNKTLTVLVKSDAFFSASYWHRLIFNFFANEPKKSMGPNMTNLVPNDEKPVPPNRGQKACNQLIGIEKNVQFARAN